MSKRRGIFKRAGRAAVISVSRVLLRPEERPLPPADEIKKILLIKIWALGEYLMATPAFRALRERYPAAEVTLMTGLAAAPLAREAPFFDRVWTVPEQAFVRHRLRQLAGVRRRLAAAGFELAVVFHHAWEFTVFTAAAGIPHRVGFDRGGDGFAHTVKVAYGARRHQVEEYFELARACGCEGAPGPMAAGAGAEAAREADHLEATIKTNGKPFIIFGAGGGVNPKTHMEAKRWPADHYVALVRELQGRFTPVLAGYGADAAVNRRIADETGAADLTAKTSLPALYLLLKRAAAFVGNDSAPMHLAAAAGTPTVAFFGPTDPALNGPWDAPALIIENDVACRPCYADGYFPACDDRRCLAGITPADAAAQIYEFLDTLKGRC